VTLWAGLWQYCVELCYTPNFCAAASPRGGLEWTCPPHFCLRLFLRLVKIRQIVRGAVRVGGSVTFGAWLASFRNGENEANLLLPLDIQKRKGCQLQVALPPDQGQRPLNRPRWGLRPQTAVIGSHSQSPCVSIPHFFHLATPLFASGVRSLLDCSTSQFGSKIGQFDISEPKSAPQHSMQPLASKHFHTSRMIHL